MNRAVLTLSTAALLLLAAPRGSAAESLVVTGTGSPGTWTTDLTITNPGPAETRVTVYETAGYQECTFPACPFVTLPIPANSTVSVATTALSFDSPTLLQTIYITPRDGDVLPVVRAQATNHANADQKNILPVVRLSTLNTLMPSVLTFPAAERTTTSHSNLAIGLVATDGTNPLFTVRLDVFDATGTLLGSGTFANVLVPELGGGANIVLSDVLAVLGIDTLTGGQIRVTTLSGDGALWGEMATVTSDCGVLMTEGINR